MEPEQISALSDQEITQHQKRAKTNRTIHAFLIGFSFAVLMVSIDFKGLGFSSLIPLVVFLLFIKMAKNNKK